MTIGIGSSKRGLDRSTNDNTSETDGFAPSIPLQTAATWIVQLPGMQPIFRTSALLSLSISQKGAQDEKTLEMGPSPTEGRPFKQKRA